MAKPLKIYGMVIVDGKTYQDDDMLQLVKEIPIKKWKFGGDQNDDESDIAISVPGKKTVSFVDLNKALKYLASSGFGPQLSAKASTKTLGKDTSKYKDQLKQINAQLTKLKQMKAVQNYLKAVRLQGKLKDKIG